MAYFKEITMGHTVVMGFNTWKSLDMKPLPGRNNIIISDVNEPIYGKDYIVSSLGLVYGLVDVELKDNKKVFIIGGDKTFMCFLDRIKSIYLTHIDKDYKCDTFATFFHNIHSNMNIVEHSKDYWSEKEQCNFRFLKYEKTNESHGEHQYLNLLKDILNNGHEKDERDDRTGTIGVFGRQLRFDISKYIPLLTTKFVGYKTIIKEAKEIFDEGIQEDLFFITSNEISCHITYSNIEIDQLIENMLKWSFILKMMSVKLNKQSKYLVVSIGNVFLFSNKVTSYKNQIIKKPYPCAHIKCDIDMNLQVIGYFYH